jgi:hypothetical protein
MKIEAGGKPAHHTIKVFIPVVAFFRVDGVVDCTFWSDFMRVGAGIYTD